MRNVIVTGGTRGLGLAIARTLRAAGYSVIAIARGESDAFRDAAREEAAGTLQFRAFDLTAAAAIPDFLKGIRQEFGPVYGLVNNAGIGSGGLLATMSDTQIEGIIRLNTVSPILLTKYVVRSMMSEGAGRIVNVASIVAITGFSGLSVYSATKAALVGFSGSLAREVGKLGITVNVVSPGFVDTDMTEGLPELQHERIVRRTALRRLAEPDDVANAVEFLLSEKARNITGITLTVDAGSTA